VELRAEIVLNPTMGKTTEASKLVRGMIEHSTGTSKHNEPPIITPSTAGLINTSGNRTAHNSEFTVDQLNVSWGLSSVGGVRVSENGRLKGYFCSENVLNLSHKILSDVEINVLGKGLEFIPTLLREDFQEFIVEE
jgi:hypothetical protein